VEQGYSSSSRMANETGINLMFFRFLHRWWGDNPVIYDLKRKIKRDRDFYRRSWKISGRKGNVKVIIFV
jgi:hypothetical protein